MRMCRLVVLSLIQAGCRENKEENTKLKEKLFRYKYIENLQDETPDEFEDKALKQFLK